MEDSMLREPAPYNERMLTLDRSTDEIEEKIIRAYLRLLFSSPLNGAPCSVRVLRTAYVDIYLTKGGSMRESGEAPFRLEAFVNRRLAPVRKYSCFGFDDDELVSAVQFVFQAQHRFETLH
jgi:hypothetical protein